MESDFSYVYGVKNEFLDGIDDFLELLVSRVLPDKLKSTEDTELLKILKEKKT